jgi:hypothetical protein
MRANLPQGCCEKISELRSGHFARGHREFAVLGSTSATDVAINRNVVGWIGEDGSCLFLLEQRAVGVIFKRASAKD